MRFSGRFYRQKLMIGFCVWALLCLCAAARIAPAIPSNSPAVEDRFFQVSFGQVSFGQVSFGQVSFGQVSFGQVLESELRLNERHSYRIPLAAHEFVRLEIECVEAGVSLELLDEAGHLAFQLEFDPQYSQHVVIHATAATSYQIRLSPDAGQTAPKQYRLRWLEKRLATESDQNEFLAQCAKQEAMTLYGQATTETLRRAVDKCREAERLYESVGARFPTATMFNLLGITLIRLGERAAAEQALQQARALFRQLGRRDKEINVLNNLSRLATRWGDFQSALDYAQQVMAFARQDGDLLRLMSGLNSLAEIYRKSGDQQKAIDLDLETVALARANRQSKYAYMHEATALMGLGQSYF
ncbi:MAG: tetratricopeptide repeat protein, partial [Acidobacteria bacterium]|nr:tetratricopeptide repeat protein [Acidobacteriota bacterium]